MEGGGWLSFMLDGHATPPPPDIISISDGSSSDHDDDHQEEEEEDAIIISGEDDEDGDERGMFIYTHILCTTLFVKQIAENKNFSFNFFFTHFDYGVHYNPSLTISLPFYNRILPVITPVFATLYDLLVAVLFSIT